MKGNIYVTSIEFRPPPQAQRSNSQREGVKFKDGSCELLTEAMSQALDSSRDKTNPIIGILGHTSVNLITELLTRTDSYILETIKLAENHYVLKLFNGQNPEPMLSEDILPTPRGKSPLGHIKEVLDQVSEMTESKLN